MNGFWTTTHESFDSVYERNDVIALVVVGYLIRTIHAKFEPIHAINAWETIENVDRASPVTFELHNYLNNMQILGHRD